MTTDDDNETIQKKGRHIRWTKICKEAITSNASNVVTARCMMLLSSCPSSSHARDKETVEDNDDDVTKRAASASSERRSSLAATTTTRGGVFKIILDDVSGAAMPGEVLAVMGPSGSGKTSLLNILSGRNSFDSGALTIDGEIMTKAKMKTLKRDVAFVKQSDLFFEELTVRDQLTFTAFIRLPKSYSTSAKHAAVDRILSTLRLTEVADSSIRRLSGGEKKRVNIGSELLTDPSVIILDEPTSSLDSANAVALIALLHDLASKESKTILTSIHQPSSATFRSFDKVMFLCEGKVIFHGTPQYSIDFLKLCSYECPDGYNVADHWMDLLVMDESDIDDAREETAKNQKDVEESVNESRRSRRRASKRFSLRLSGSTALLSTDTSFGCVTPRTQLSNMWELREAGMMDDDDEGFGSDCGSDVEIIEYNTKANRTMDKSNKVGKYRTSWWTQLYMLSWRSVKIGLANVITYTNFVKIFLMSIIMGLLWFRMENTENTVHDRTAYLFFSINFWSMTAVLESMLSFPMERTVIMKETASGSYDLSAYFLAKTISDAPVRILSPAIYMVISFWLAMPYSQFMVFILTTCCAILSVLASESVGLLVGASIMNVEHASVVCIVTYMVFGVVGGFYVRDITTVLTNLRYISCIAYAYNASLGLVFNTDIPCDGSGALGYLCDDNPLGFITREELLDYLGVKNGVWFDFGMIFLIIILCRVGAYFALKRQFQTGEERN